MKPTDEDPEIPVSLDDFTVIDPTTGESFGAVEREQLTKDIDHPVIWSIGPADPFGIRGVPSDMKSLYALGAHGGSILTGLLSEHPALIKSFEPDFLEQQWNDLIETCPPLALKISGPLPLDLLQWLGEKLSLQEVFTVTLASIPEGISEEDINIWRFYLMPYVSMLVLSRADAARLSGHSVNTVEEVEECAAGLLKYGCRSVFIVNDPLSSSGKEPVCDFWSNGTQKAWLRSAGVAGSHPLDGHWDVFCCAVASFQVQAYLELDALILARMTAQQSLRQRYPLGLQKETVWPTGNLHRKDLIPELSYELPLRSVSSFCAPLRDLSPGWCPVAAKSDALSSLFELGARTAVLHIPNKNHPHLEEEITKAVELSDRYESQLFIQTHWELAITHLAFGILLQASELNDAVVNPIQESGQRLGVLVRSYTDLAAAMMYRPSCILVGPVFSDDTNPDAPILGYDFFKAIRRLIPIPVFAFGGMVPEQKEPMSLAGADGLVFPAYDRTDDELKELFLPVPSEEKVENQNTSL